MLLMGKSTISIAIFNSYFDITRPGILWCHQTYQAGKSMVEMQVYSLENHRYIGEFPW